jgi:hypothetical protein
MKPQIVAKDGDTVEKVENLAIRKTSRKALLFYRGGQ